MSLLISMFMVWAKKRRVKIVEISGGVMRFSENLIHKSERVDWLCIAQAVFCV